MIQNNIRPKIMARAIGPRHVQVKVVTSDIATYSFFCGKAKPETKKLTIKIRADERDITISHTISKKKLHYITGYVDTADILEFNEHFSNQSVKNWEFPKNFKRSLLPSERFMFYPKLRFFDPRRSNDSLIMSVGIIGLKRSRWVVTGVIRTSDLLEEEMPEEKTDCRVFYGTKAVGNSIFFKKNPDFLRFLTRIIRTEKAFSPQMLSICLKNRIFEPRF